MEVIENLQDIEETFRTSRMTKRFSKVSRIFGQTIRAKTISFLMRMSISNL